MKKSMLFLMIVCGFYAVDSSCQDYNGSYYYRMPCKGEVDFTLCPSGIYFLEYDFSTIDLFTGYPSMIEMSVDTGHYEIDENILVFFNTKNNIQYRFKIIDTLNLQVLYSIDTLFCEDSYIHRKQRHYIDPKPEHPCPKNRCFIWHIYKEPHEENYRCAYKRFGDNKPNIKYYSLDSVIILPKTIYRMNE